MVHRLRLDGLEDDLPAAVRLGRRLSLAALVMALCALIGVGVLASRKADRAGADALATRRQSALVVCALANAQRAGNPKAPPATTERGLYVANIWEAAFATFGCGQFTAAQLAEVAGQLATPSPTATGSR